MSEELLQRKLIENPEKIGKWDFYNIGATSIKSLKENKILKSLAYPAAIERRKPDGLIVYKGQVIALISNKLPKKLVKDKEVADWIGVTKALNSKLLIITDAKTKTHWVNALTGKVIKDENGNELKTVFDPNHDSIPKLIESINSSINTKNNQIVKAELLDPTALAKSVWQDIWMASGDDAENCLYTFVELFIFKYLSDLGILTGSYSFTELLKRYEQDEPEQVLDYYVRFIRTEIKKKFEEDKHDGTTIINGSTFVNKKGEPVSGYSTVFKKVLEQFRDYEKKFGKFDHIHYEFKSKVFETFLKQSISKKNWGQYFTPLKVVRAIVKMAKSDIREGMTIGDPACGVGKFLLEVIADNPHKYYKIEKGVVKSKINLVGYDKGFVDKEQKTIILAKANMLIYLSDLIRENPSQKYCNEFSQQFNNSFKLQTKTTLGTLVNPEVNKYDVILTNPPYVTSGSSNLKEEIKTQGLEYHYTVSSLGIEGLFTEWIIKALRPEGKAFIVVPDGILNRTTDKRLRKYITDECFIDAIISLPAKTFFTTIKKTYILAITKKSDKNEVQKDPVFTYLVSEIGETLDVYRFDTDENHLDVAAGLFNQFKNDKPSFKTTDKRCKVQPISKFYTDQHWSVDRWWSQEELIDLGIKSEDEKISIDEFGSFIAEIANSILAYQKPVEKLTEKKNLKPKYKKVKLSDKSFFEIFIGKRLLKKDVKDVNGSIPAYSANVFKPFAQLTKSNITNFSYDSVLWGIDGDFEFNFIPKNKKFATTDHCGTIQIKSDKILPTYLLFQLNEIKKELGYDRALRASIKNMKDVEIKIPINEKGKIDMTIQKQVSQVYETVLKMQEQIKFFQNKLDHIFIDVEGGLETSFIEFPLSQIFNLQDGFAFPSSCFTKNPADVKLIRIQDINEKSNPKEIRIPTTFKFPNKEKFVVNKGDYLLSLSGAAGFNIKKWNGERGYLNQRITLIKLKEEYTDQLIEGYELIIFKQIYKELNSLGTSQNNNLSRNDLKKITIKIPVTKGGGFDLVAQKVIHDKYAVIEDIKKQISEKLERVLVTKIGIDE